MDLNTVKHQQYNKKMSRAFSNPEDYTNTEKKIRFENGKEFTVFSRDTKKGERFYYWASGRFLPISKKLIEKYKI